VLGVGHDGATSLATSDSAAAQAPIRPVRRSARVLCWGGHRWPPSCPS